MTSFEIVPCLDEARDQLNDRFPKRAKKAEGGIGDAAHQKEISSHNPDDELGVSAEHNDHDGVHEVRARDFDKNLKDKDVSMEDVVQLWVKLARQGTLWWVRYIIFNGRIWHERDGFKTHAYTGSNKHVDHVHVTSGFDQKSDTVTGTNWHLADLKKGTAADTPSKPAVLNVDGRLGEATIKRWQQIMRTPVDGKISTPKSDLVHAVQLRLKGTVNHRLAVDGEFGRDTIVALQKYLGSPADGFISKPKSQVVMALQRRLNTGKF
jgi:hypothetical protein